MSGRRLTVMEVLGTRSSDLKMPFLLYAGLMVLISTNDTVKSVSSADVYKFVDKGKIYKIPDTAAEFKTAKKFCERDGGLLAKITQPTVTENFSAPLSQFLSRRVGKSCVWIGATNLGNMASWRWADGELIKNTIVWKVPPDYLYASEMYVLRCGRLCQGDNVWVWEQAKCDTPLKYVCQYDDPDAEQCWAMCTTRAPPTSTGKAVSSADANRHSANGKIFRIPDHETDFAKAWSFCERENGSLAKITPVTGTANLDVPMARFLSSRVGDSCVWIGASDRKVEGHWVWPDGQPVYLVRWTTNRHTYIFLKNRKDCGRMCPSSGEWEWRPDYCDISSNFVCEYEEPDLKVEVKPTLKAEVKPVLAPKPLTVGQTAGEIVITRILHNNLIIGEPLFVMSVPMATMCSRVCTKRNTCGLFNFNMATRECRGHGLSSTVTYKEIPKWEVWAVKRV